MKNILRVLLAGAVLSASFTTARADDPVKTQNAIELFRHAGKSAWFFHHSYGYAIFPTIGDKPERPGLFPGMMPAETRACDGLTK